MNTRTDKAKLDFAQRLHKGMDLAGYPVRGRARVLSREFEISDKGAGKWLNGEAIPETSKIPHLAKFLKVNAEWLLTGIDNSNVEPKPLEEFSVDKLKNQDIQDLVESLIILEMKGKLSKNLIEAINAVIRLNQDL
ncbi:hypothetical protein F900_01378 [Acinetobacter modestus]|uniref:Transcription regulator BetR N-terminal domain-containing protein n=1 Tax=Acinetobacter modestus TaxID=1776740 RepID=N9M1C2_9GAMM|nr:helix-turn-helix domain-containing protein [Acinetobacter modestus]ENX02314.1 hypothetical protein F900_01378 [Acinetobacter modestus]